jgi:mono/diheme cytochrome c family protein
MRSLWLSIPISLFILSLQPASAQQRSVAKDLLDAKCTLCHTSKRIFTTDTKDLKDLVARMTAKNPEWFRKTDSRHLLESLETMLDDPEILAMQDAWEKTVSRGETLFGDPELGSNGKSCADCHTAESLRKVKGNYPKYDVGLGKMVSLEEHLNYMVVKKLEGEPLQAGDERILALALYIKSLR